MLKNGVKLKIPENTVPDPYIIVFCVVSFLLGTLLCFYIMTVTKVHKMEVLVKSQQVQTEKLVDILEYHQVWKKLVDERFAEQGANIRRLYFETRVSMDEDSPATDRYRTFLETEGDVR